MNIERSLEKKSVLINSNKDEINPMINSNWKNKDIVMINFKEDPKKILEDLKDSTKGKLTIINLSKTKPTNDNIINIDETQKIAKLTSEIDKSYTEGSILVFNNINFSLNNFKLSNLYKLIHGLITIICIKEGTGIFFIDKSNIKKSKYKLIKNLFDFKYDVKTRKITEIKEKIKYLVMIIEDDKMVLDLYEKILEKDYNIIKAKTGKEAKSKLTKKIDLILLDRRLPDKDGLEILKEIKNDSNLKKIPVMMLTGLEPDFNVKEMPLEGYLEKPINPSKLRSTVHDILYKGELEEKYNKLNNHLIEYQEKIKSNQEKNLKNNKDIQQLNYKIRKTSNKLKYIIEKPIRKKGLNQISSNLIK